MTDSVKSIREAIEARIESVSGFTKLDNKFNLEKNNNANLVERYGVIAGEGSPVDEASQGYIAISRSFGITVCNKFTSTMNKDDKQEEIGDILENAMESIIDSLESTSAGLPLVTTVEYSANDAVEYEEVENLAILRFTMAVRYRKFLGC